MWLLQLRGAGASRPTGPLSVPREGVRLAPDPGVFSPSQHLAILPCHGQVRPHPALSCGLWRTEGRSVPERSERVLSAGVSPCPRPGFPSNPGRDANQENDCSSLGCVQGGGWAARGPCPGGSPGSFPLPALPSHPYSLYPCAGCPLTRRVPPGPSRERRSEGRARRHGASGTYPGAFASPGRRSPVTASARCGAAVGSRAGLRGLPSVLPWLRAADPAPCPRDAACWQLGGGGSGGPSTGTRLGFVLREADT